MFKNIQKALKEDLWKRIDMVDEGSYVQWDFFHFFRFVFHLFLQKYEFGIDDIVKASQELKDAYYKILHESEQIAINDDPFKAIKHIHDKFDDLINPLIEKIRGDGLFYGYRNNT